MISVVSKAAGWGLHTYACNQANNGKNLFSVWMINYTEKNRIQQSDDNVMYPPTYPFLPRNLFAEANPLFVFGHTLDALVIRSLCRGLAGLSFLDPEFVQACAGVTIAAHV